jgi:hypothetical protein
MSPIGRTGSQGENAATAQMIAPHAVLPTAPMALRRTRIEPRHFHSHSSVLSGLLSVSQVAQSLQRFAFAGTARDYLVLPAFPDCFYPVVPPARNNHEVHACTSSTATGSLAIESCTWMRAAAVRRNRE